MPSRTRETDRETLPMEKKGVEGWRNISEYQKQTRMCVYISPFESEDLCSTVLLDGCCCGRVAVLNPKGELRKKTLFARRCIV